MTPPLSYEDLMPGKTYLAVCLEGKKQTNIVYTVGGRGPELLIFSQHDMSTYKLASDCMMWDFYEIDLPPLRKLRTKDIKENGPYFIIAPEAIADKKRGPSTVCDIAFGDILFFGSDRRAPLSSYDDYWFIQIQYPTPRDWKGE